MDRPSRDECARECQRESNLCSVRVLSVKPSAVAKNKCNDQHPPVGRQLEEAVHVHGEKRVNRQRKEAEGVAFEGRGGVRVPTDVRRNLQQQEKTKKNGQKYDPHTCASKEEEERDVKSV